MTMRRVAMDGGARLVVDTAREGDIEMARAYLGVSMVDAIGQQDPESPAALKAVLVQCGYVLLCCFQEIHDQLCYCDPGAAPVLPRDGAPEPAYLSAGSLFDAYKRGSYRLFMTRLAATDDDAENQEPMLALIFGATAAGEASVRLERAFRLPSYVRS